jgi:bacterioferritin-associated ferredoxin
MPGHDYIRQKRVINERKAAGMCTLCGERSPQPGLVQGKPRVNCRECLDHAAGVRSGAIMTAFEAIDARLTSLGRCRCGLALPCGGCVPTAREIAESRRAVEMPGSCE